MMKKFTLIVLIITLNNFGFTWNTHAQDFEDDKYAYIVVIDDQQQHIYQINQSTSEAIVLFSLPLLSDEPISEFLPDEEIQVIRDFLLNTRGFILEQGFTEDDLYATLTLTAQISIEKIRISPDGLHLALLVGYERCIPSLSYCYGVSKIITIATNSITDKSEAVYEMPFHAADSINIPQRCNFDPTSKFDYVKISEVAWLYAGNGIVYSNMGNRSCFNATGQSSPIIVLPINENNPEPILLGYGTSWNIVPDNQVIMTSRDTLQKESYLSLVKFDIVAQTVTSTDYVLDGDTYVVSNAFRLSNGEMVALATDLFWGNDGLMLFQDDNNQTQFVTFPDGWEISFSQVKYTRDGRIVVLDTQNNLAELQLTDENTLELSPIWNKSVSEFFISSQNEIWIKESDSESYQIINISGEVLAEFRINLPNDANSQSEIIAVDS